LHQFNRPGYDERTRDLVLRSVLAVLTTPSITGTEPAIAALLRSRPERTEVVTTLWLDLLHHSRYRRRASEALGLAIAALSTGEPEASRVADLLEGLFANTRPAGLSGRPLADVTSHHHVASVEPGRRALAEAAASVENHHD
jgi:hypothetical protein